MLYVAVAAYVNAILFSLAACLICYLNAARLLLLDVVNDRKTLTAVLPFGQRLHRG